MGMHLSDPLPPRRFPCWGATILESLRGTHLAEPGDRYCKRCRKLVDDRRLAAALRVGARSRETQ
jgi:hypothetical protein